MTALQSEIIHLPSPLYDVNILDAAVDACLHGVAGLLVLLEECRKSCSGRRMS